MEAQFVRSQDLGNGGVIIQRGFQEFDIPLVVNTFLEFADKSGGEADQFHTAADTLIRDDVVLRRVVG
jgi:hypothetical protein